MSGLLGEVLDPLLGSEVGANVSASLSQVRASSPSGSSEEKSLTSRAPSFGPEVPSSVENAPPSSSRAPTTTNSPSQTLMASSPTSSSQSAASLESVISSSIRPSIPTSLSTATSARQIVATSLASTASSVLVASTSFVSAMSISSSPSSKLSGVITTSTPVAVESFEDQGTIFTPNNRMFPLGVVIIVAAVLVTSIVMTLRLLRCTEHRRRRRELDADAPDFFEPGTSTADLIRSQTYEKSPSILPAQIGGGFERLQPGVGPASSSWTPGTRVPSNRYLMPNAAGQRDMPPRSPESFYAPPLAYPLQDGPYPVHTGATRDLFQVSDAYHYSRQGSGDSEEEHLRRSRPRDFV